MSQTAFSVKNKKVVVMGLGLHGGGVSVVQWLYKQQAKILVTDIRNAKILEPSLKKISKLKKIKFVLGRHRNKDFQDADLIIKNPGVSKRSNYLRIARKNNVRVESEVSLFLRYCKSPVIGITGSKGKSTTTMLIYEILKKANKKPAIGGNIRISPLKLITTNKTRPVVLELSSWQLEDMLHMKFKPYIGVLTNIIPDHLNEYSSMKAYASSKANLFKFQSKSDYAVLNYDNAMTKAIGIRVRSQRLWFSKTYFSEQNGSYLKGNAVYFRHDGSEKRLCSIMGRKIPGIHNIENILAAVTVTGIMGIRPSVIQQALNSFNGVAARLELIRSYRGTKYYNDTTATSPHAAIAALQTFPHKVTLIAGGYDKKLAYKEMARVIQKRVSKLILFHGTATTKLVRELKKVKFSKWEYTSNMQEAVVIALKKKSKSVLLSPGAASFGMFLNEFDRGDQFTKAVKKLS